MTPGRNAAMRTDERSDRPARSTNARRASAKRQEISSSDHRGNVMNARAALESTAAFAAMCLPYAAWGQAVPDDAVTRSATDSPADIVVTGSRVRSASAIATSPLIEVGAREVALQGTPSAETLLNALPQVSGSNSAGQSTFGTPGIATVNLRKLGPNRTLVLIDGRRLMPGDPTL